MSIPQAYSLVGFHPMDQVDDVYHLVFNNRPQDGWESIAKTRKDHKHGTRNPAGMLVCWYAGMGSA